MLDIVERAVCRRSGSMHVRAFHAPFQRHECRAQFTCQGVERSNLWRVGCHERDHQRHVVDVDQHDVIEEGRDALHGPELELPNLIQRPSVRLFLVH